MNKKLCPICSKPSEKESMPFCSNRCKTIDLGAWATDKYRIPLPQDQSENNAEDEHSEE